MGKQYISIDVDTANKLAGVWPGGKVSCHHIWSPKNMQKFYNNNNNEMNRKIFESPKSILCVSIKFTPFPRARSQNQMLNSAVKMWPLCENLPIFNMFLKHMTHDYECNFTFLMMISFLVIKFHRAMWSNQIMVRFFFSLQNLLAHFIEDNLVKNKNKQASFTLRHNKKITPFNRSDVIQGKHEIVVFCIFIILIHCIYRRRISNAFPIKSTTIRYY